MVCLVIILTPEVVLAELSQESSQEHKALDQSNNALAVSAYTIYHYALYYALTYGVSDLQEILRSIISSSALLRFLNTSFMWQRMDKDRSECTGKHLHYWI